MNPLERALSRYRPRTEVEPADTKRILDLLSTVDDPWSRSDPLHVTASALIVHPSSRRVLLRWHAHMRQWLQVGGHADAGESDPLAIAIREGREETGLTDLVAWPGAGIVHLAVVPVPANGDEPEHEHADLRYLLATETPDLARPEHAHTPIRWLTKSEALAATAQDNVRETLARTYELIAGTPA